MEMRIMEILYGARTVLTLGYNSAESEPIWIKKIWSTLSTLLWLALADFGRDPIAQ